MRSSKFTLTTGIAALALLAGLFTLPSRAAEGEERERPRRGRGQIFPGGFGGVTSVEAQEAQQLLQEGKALQEQRRYSAALGRYKRVYKRFPRSAAAPEAYYQSALIFLEQDKPTKAFEMFDVVVRGYPDFGRFNELISEEYRIAYELIKGRKTKFLGVIPGTASREKGIQYFERLVYNAPYSDYAPLALMNVANEYMRTNETEMAVDALDRLITNYPNSLVTGDAYLRMAQVHQKAVDGPLYDQGATRESISFYEDFLILFPGDPNVGEAEEGLADMREMLARSRLKIADFYYFKRERYQAARVFYNEAITIAPTSESARLARERIANLEVDEARAEAKQVAEASRKPGLLSRIFRRPQLAPPAPIVPGATGQPGPAASGGQPEPGPVVTPQP